MKKDHDCVKALFDDFKKAEKRAAKERIMDKALAALKIHSILEEEMFYPAVRAHVGNKVMNEADEEHHVAKVLIAELDRDTNKDHRDAKFTVLAENVRHHINEEENEILSKSKELNIDFQALGQRMLHRKKQLHKDGIPPDAEHAMVAKVNGKGDSSTNAARRGRMSRAKKATKVSGVRERKLTSHASR